MNALHRCATAALVALSFVGAAHAQAPRKFTQYTLRGAIVFGDYPQISLNGQLTRLAPGGRVRNLDNLVVSAATLAGLSAVVNYTLDLGGNQVRDVWILRPEEVAVTPWPTTPDQARTWTFNLVDQTWTQP